MPDLPSLDDLFRIARDEALSKNAKLSRDAIEREGMDANLLVAVSAAMADECVGQTGDLAAALFLDSAPGQDQNRTDLDRLVFDRYGIVRKPASAAQGSVNFSCSIASPTTFAIPAGALLQTASGIQYVTVESTTFLIGTLGPTVVAVRSVLAGQSQQTQPNTITSISSSIPSSAPTLTVTNPLATAGADDVETDASLRDRARKFFSSARRGTKRAIEIAALGVPGVRTATAFEMTDALGRPARFVQLVIADAYTDAFADYTTAPPRYATQSQFLTASVFSALSDTRADGIYIQVVVAQTVLTAVQLALAFQAGTNVNQAALLARAACANYVNSLSPGDALDVAVMSQALQTIQGLTYTGREIVSPAGNIVANPLQVIRTSLSQVSALAAQTNQPIVTGINPDAYLLATS